MVLPEGVRAVWDLGKAHEESTATRELVCINGLWRWQPAEQDAAAVPLGTWGYFKVPGPWPGITNWLQYDSQTVHAHPAWSGQNLEGITAAWYQREITVPAEWRGRRIGLRADYINSFATVYVDGRKAGEMRFPAGDLDLSAFCRPGETHVLSMHVVAMPLRAVMLSFSDSNAAREVRGAVERRGLCGNVYLSGTPQGPRIAEARASTSTRKREITFDAALEDAAADGLYTVQAEILDDGRAIASFTGPEFRGSDLVDGRVRFSAGWMPDRLWDLHTPENQYAFSLRLLASDGALIDQSVPERFGFREFWTDGRDFYLNGTRIFLSAIPLDNGQIGVIMANYEAARESLERLRSTGINFVYTHNYGCTPGSHVSFEEILRAADDVGMLVALSQPHFGQYDWDAEDAEQTNGYADHAAFYARVAGNHPSVVFYSTSHNATGYNEDMDPDMIDGIQDPRQGQEWSMRSVRRALRAEAIINKVDPSRIVYHHSSGNLSSMHTSNFYGNFIPVQEMSDWFEHWATEGVKPVFTCEYGVPCTWDWTMYRGYYKGRRGFGSAAVPWEFCIAEWNAQFLGDRAFEISDRERANMRWEAGQFRQGRLWQRWEYPYQLGSSEFDEYYPALAMYIADNWPAFRTWGMSANNFWDYSIFWRVRPGVDRSRRELPVDWENLQRPGLSPDYIGRRYERMDLAFERTDWMPTPAAEAVYRNNMPLLAYIAGKPSAFTSKDHNFLPGETVEKQLIVINNSRETVTCEYRWSLDLHRAVSGRGSVTVATGEQERISLAIELPQDLAPGRYELEASVRFSNGERQQDKFTVDVLPAPRPVEAAGRVAVFDPKGETLSLLSRLGIGFTAVGPDADLTAYDVLVLGKGALTLDGPAPEVSRVRDGLKVVIFEQTGQVLERRFGFRTAEYGLREVSRRVPGHPLLEGVADENLRNWRGEATILPARLDYELATQFNLAPTVKWCDIPVTRVWRCGNRGNVASALIEKPAAGDFLPIVDGGYSLQYTPLAEFREGRGMVLFCQMDVTGRTESDPAADALARNIVQYAADWQPTPRRQVVYAGDALGRRQLESAGLTPLPYEQGKLPADQVLVVGPGGSRQLAGDAAAVADWLRAGGRLLALGLDGAEASSFLPLDVKTTSAEHIASYFEPAAFGSLLAGVGPADVHNRDPKDLPLVTAGATPVGNGVLATADGLNVVFCQMVPGQVTPALGTPTAFTPGRDASGKPGALMSLGPVTPGGARLSQRVEGVESGKAYTFAVTVQAQGNDATARIGVEYSARRRGRGRRPADGPPPAVGPLVTGEDVRLQAGQPTELHVTFTADEAAGQGVLVYLTSAMTGARLWVDGARLYEGPYVPAGQGDATANLLQNGDFSAGAEQWQFDFTQQRNLKRTYRRTSCLVTRLLANMGAAGRTRLLEHIAQPVAEGERRWLDGLYLDVPEDWDEPYRFFRW